MATQELTARPLEWNPPRQAISRVPYLPGLDGVRALAVVAVMLYHTNRGWLPGGFIGVEVFFVISGYLITLLLIGEHEKSGMIHLRQFWMRRARRLLPALFLMMALLMVYTALFERDTLGLLRGDVMAGLGYVTNWYQIWVGQGYTAAADFAPLRHLWSLAVEEQFYLVWPLVMVGLIRLGRRRLPEISRWLALAAVGIAVIMGLLYHPGPVGTASVTPEAYWDVGGRSISKMDGLYLSTITRSTGLLIGGAFAMLWRPVAVMRGPLRTKGPLLDAIGMAGLVALGAMSYYLHVVTPDGADPWLFRGGFLAVDVATVMMIAAVTHRRARAGVVLGNPLLNWIGTRSYGLYLFHWPIYQILRETAGNKLEVGEFVVAMILTASITELSYRFLEMPIRRQQLGRWWRRLQESRDPRSRQIFVGTAVSSVCLFGFATVSMATAPLKLNEVEQSLRDAEESVTAFDELVDTTTVPPTAPPQTAAPVVADDAAATTTTAPPTTKPPTTTLPPDVEHLAIGDSVMKGAAPSLRTLGFTVVAEESIQFSEVTSYVEALMQQGTTPELVVVSLGTNGTIDEDDAERMFEALGPVPHVIALTVAADRSWVPRNNELIRKFEGRFSNVRVLNWDALASGCVDWAERSGLEGNCFAGDDIHLSADGADYYAELIRWVAVEELGVAL